MRIMATLTAPVAGHQDETDQLAAATPIKAPVVPSPEDQPTMTVWPEAAKALGLSRSAAYEAASRGQIPVLRIGTRLLVPTAALRKLLQLDAA